MNTVEDKLDVSASSASSSAGLGPTLSVARPSPAQSNTDVSKYAEELIKDPAVRSSANSTASFKDGRCESGMDKMGSVLDITGLIHTWNVRLSFMKGDAPGPKEQEEKQKVQKLPKIFNVINGAVKKFEFGESQEAIRQDSRRRANRRKFTITLNYFGEPEDFTDPRPWVKKFDKNHNPNNKALVYWVRQMQRQDKGHELGPPPPGLDLPCQMARQEEPIIFIGRKNSSIYFAGITKIGDSDTPQVREEAGGAPAEKEARGESPLEALLKPSEKTDSPWTGKESTSKPDDLGGKSGGSSVTREAKGARMTGLFPAKDVPSGKRSPKSGSSGGTPETEPAQTKKGTRVKPTAVADSYGAANRVKTSILKITVSVTERLMAKNRCLRILNRAVSIVDPIMQSTEAVLVDPTLFVGLIYQVNQTYSTMEASTLGLSRILSGAVSGVVTKVAGLMPLLGATKEGGLPVLTSNAPVDRTDTATSSDNCLMAIRVSPPPSVSAVDVQNATGAQPRSDRPRQKTKLSKGRFPVRGEIPGIKNVMPTASMPRKASIPCMARNPIRPHTQAQSGKSEKPDSKEVVKVECDAKRSPQKSQKSDEEQKGTIWKVPDRRRRSSLHPPVVKDLKNTLKRREEERQEKKQALPFTSQSSAVSQKSTVAKYEKGKKEDTTSLQTSQAVMKGDAPKTKELEEEEKLQKLEKIPTTNVIEGAVKKYELEERQEKTALAFTPPPFPPSLPGGSAPAQAAPVVYTTQTAQVGQRATVSSREQDVTKISTETATMATMMEAQFAAPPAPPPLPPPDYYLSGGDESDDETPKEQAPPQEAARVYVPPKFLTRFQSQEFRHVEFRPSPLSRAASSVAGSDVGSVRSSRASTPAGTPRSSSPVGRDRTSQGVQSTALALALRDVEESRDAAHGMMQPRRDSPAFLLQPQTTQLKYSTTVRRKTSTVETEDTAEASHVVATGQADRIPSPPPLSSFGLGLLSAHQVSAMSPLSPVTLGQALHDAIERRGHAVPGHMQSSSLGNDGLSVRLQSQATKLIHSTTVRRKTSTRENEDTAEASHMVATVQADRIPSPPPLSSFGLGLLSAHPASAMSLLSPVTLGKALHDAIASRGHAVPGHMQSSSTGNDGLSFRLQSQATKLKDSTTVRRKTSTGETEDTTETSHMVATVQADRIPTSSPLPAFSLGAQALIAPPAAIAIPSAAPTMGLLSHSTAAPALPVPRLGGLTSSGLPGGRDMRHTSTSAKVRQKMSVNKGDETVENVAEANQAMATTEVVQIPPPTPLPTPEQLRRPSLPRAMPHLMMHGAGFGRFPSPPALPPMELLTAGISGGFERVPSPPALPPVELLMAGISSGFGRPQANMATTLNKMTHKIKATKGDETVENVAEASETLGTMEVGHIPELPPLPTPEQLKRPSLPQATPHLMMHGAGFGRIPSPPALPPMELLMTGISGGFGRVPSPPALPPMELLMTGISGGFGRVPSPPALPPVGLLIAGISGGSGRVPSPPALPPMELLMAGTSGGFGRVPSPPALPPVELLIAGISGGSGRVPSPPALPPVELLIAGTSGGSGRVPSPPALPPMELLMTGISGGFGRVPSPPALPPMELLIAGISGGSGRVPSPPALPPMELLMAGISGGFGRVPSPPALPPMELLMAGISGGFGRVPSPPTLPPMELLMTGISGGFGRVPSPPALPPMELLMAGTSGGFGRVPSPPALPPMELLMAGISDGKNVEEAGQTVATMEAGHIPAPLPLPTPEQLGQPITLPQLPQSGPRPIMALMLAEPAGPAIPQPPPLPASLMSPCRDGGTFMRSTTASNKITHNTKATKGDETVENVAEASETVDTMEFGHILEPPPLPTPEQLRRPSLPRAEPHLMMHGAGFGRVPSPPALPPVELLIAGISGGSGGVPFPPALPAIEFLMSEISSTSRQVPNPPALPTMEFLMSGISGFPERDASQASPRPRLDLVGSGAMQPLPDPNRQYTAMSTYAAQESNLSQKRSVTRRDEGTEHSIGTKAAALHPNIPEPPPLPMINYFVPNCDYPRDTFEHQIAQTVARFSHRRELFIKLCQDKEDVTDFLIGLEEDESQFSPEVVEEMREEAKEELARINASFSELLMTTSARNQVKDAGGSQCSEESLEPRQVPAERSIPIHHKTPQKDPRTHTCRIHSRSEDSASKIPLVRTPRQTSERKYPYRQPGEKAYSSGKGTRSRGLPKPKVVVTPAMRPQPASETESASGMAEDQSFAPRGRTPLKNVHVRKADGSRSPPGLAAGKTDEQSARGSAETVAKTQNGTVKGGKAGMTRKEYNESGSSNAQAIPSKDAKKTDSVSKDAAAKRFGPEGSTKKDMSSKVKGPQKAGASGTPHTPKKTVVTYKDVRSKLTASVKVARASSTAKSTHTGSSKSSLHSKDENAPATGPSGQTKESTQDKKENPSLEASQKGANVPKAGPSGVQTAKSAPTKIPQASKDVDAKGTTLAIGRSAMSPRRTDMQATDKTPVKQTAHSPSKIPRPVQRAVKRTVPIIWTKSPGDGEGCGTSMRSTTASNKMTHKGDETVPVENVAEARETVGTMEVGRIPKPPPLPPPEQLRRPSLPRATTHLMMHRAGFGRVPSPPALPPVELLMSKKMTHKTKVTKGDETVDNAAEASETAATMEAVHIPETPPLPTPEQLRRPSTFPQAAPQLNMVLQTAEPSALGTSQYPPSLMSPAHGQGGATQRDLWRTGSSSMAPGATSASYKPPGIEKQVKGDRSPVMLPGHVGASTGVRSRPSMPGTGSVPKKLDMEVFDSSEDSEDQIDLDKPVSAEDLEDDEYWQALEKKVYAMVKKSMELETVEEGSAKDETPVQEASSTVKKPSKFSEMFQSRKERERKREREARERAMKEAAGKNEVPHKLDPPTAKPFYGPPLPPEMQKNTPEKKKTGLTRHGHKGKATLVASKAEEEEPSTSKKSGGKLTPSKLVGKIKGGFTRVKDSIKSKLSGEESKFNSETH
ncbi:uncharacterized protein LOC144883261 [Branchiostoma floridae x Branchiostoma japonicum]